jgi:hypothetical protein
MTVSGDITDLPEPGHGVTRQSVTLFTYLHPSRLASQTESAHIEQRFSFTLNLKE